MSAHPNLVFIFSDQQHWQALGCCDETFDTPHLDAFAAQSVQFSHAFCATPQCSPSRSAILTGRYPSKTGVWSNMDATGGDPLQLRTIGALLQQAGYYTAYFGKWHLGDEAIATAGWDVDLGVTGEEVRDDPQVTQHALEFLQRAPQLDKPFALFLSYNNPHDIYGVEGEQPMRPREPLELPRSWREKDLATVPAVQRQFMAEDQGRFMTGADEAAWQRYRERYRDKVKLYDTEVGQVLEALDSGPLGAQSAVVITSDHGDMDGQQGLVYKGPFMYDHLTRVPLMIRLPEGQRPAPRTEAFLTVNVDTVPTLLDLAGAEVPASDGLSLRPLLTGEGKTLERDFVIGQYYCKQRWVNPIRMIRTRGYKYNRYADGGEELYELNSDPDEIHNRASDLALAQVKADLSARLDQWMEVNEDPFPTQQPTDRQGN